MNYLIKDICRSKGMAIGTLADAIGMKRESLSRIVNGANTSTETLEKIASALGVNVTELFAPSPTNTIICPKCGTALEVKEKE